MAKSTFFDDFNQWYKDGIADDKDLATCLEHGALTEEEIDEIKNGNGG